MAKQTNSGWKSWACSFILLLVGCSGLTIGPVVEKKVIIIHAGVPIEILEQETLEARILSEDGKGDIFEVDVGGWIAFHPDHYKSLQATVERLKANQKDPQ